jgi:hypothetical protein
MERQSLGWPWPLKLMLKELSGPESTLTGACSDALVLSVGLQNTDSLGVSAETMDPYFDG